MLRSNICVIRLRARSSVCLTVGSLVNKNLIHCYKQCTESETRRQNLISLSELYQQLLANFRGKRLCLMNDVWGKCSCFCCSQT